MCSYKKWFSSNCRGGSILISICSIIIFKFLWIWSTWIIIFQNISTVNKKKLRLESKFYAQLKEPTNGQYRKVPKGFRKTLIKRLYCDSKGIQKRFQKLRVAEWKKIPGIKLNPCKPGEKTIKNKYKLTFEKSKRNLMEKTLVQSETLVAYLRDLKDGFHVSVIYKQFD